MARALVFRRGSTELEFGLDRIDRRKLYGYVETEALDAQGRSCELALLGGDGRTLVGRGGSALLLLDPDGNHLERQELTPVGPDSAPLARVPSSFESPISLSVQASVDELLSHNVKAAYVLTPPMGAGELVDELRRGVIYTFPFSFRGGLEPDVGFLVANSEGVPFLLVGKPTRLEFVSLAELTDPETDLDEPADADDEDDVDFAMI